MNSEYITQLRRCISKHSAKGANPHESPAFHADFKLLFAFCRHIYISNKEAIKYATVMRKKNQKTSLPADEHGKIQKMFSLYRKPMFHCQFTSDQLITNCRIDSHRVCQDVHISNTIQIDGRHSAWEQSFLNIDISINVCVWWESSDRSSRVAPKLACCLGRRKANLGTTLELWTWMQYQLTTPELLIHEK